MLDYVTIHGDSAEATSRWRFSGASRANTDEGRVYVSLSQSMGDITVSVYRDSARTRLVAQGTLAGVTGSLTLSAQNASGLSGSVELLSAAANGAVELDVFFACGDDLTQLQQEAGKFLSAGTFAGELGFSAPCASAKRLVDALLAARGLRRLRLDSLTPLAKPCAHYALAFVYDHLAHRDGEPAAWQANRHRALARAALAEVEVSINGECQYPFIARVMRA